MRAIAWERCTSGCIESVLGTEAFALTFDGLTQPIHISPETLFTFLERYEAKAMRQGQ